MPRPLRSCLLAAALAACTPVNPEAVPDAIPDNRPTPSAALLRDQFLRNRRLAFEVPPGFRELEVAANNNRWVHTIAIASTTLDLEIRFSTVWPAEHKLRTACNRDPRCLSAPSQAFLAELLRAAVADLAVPGSELHAKEFPLDAVRNEFGAHWGGAVGFDVDPAYSDKKKGLAVVLFREPHGAAMSLSLAPEFDDATDAERMKAFHALRFADPFVARMPEHAALAGTFWHCNEFSYLRFEPTTLTRMTLSAAMAVMGQRVPYETEYAELTYLPDNHLSATPFRVDNFEQGDRTPKTPTPVTYTHAREGDRLTFKAETWLEPWACTLVPR